MRTAGRFEIKRNSFGYEWALITADSDLSNGLVHPADRSFEVTLYSMKEVRDLHYLLTNLIRDEVDE